LLVPIQVVVRSL